MLVLRFMPPRITQATKRARSEASKTLKTIALKAHGMHDIKREKNLVPRSRAVGLD